MYDWIFLLDLRIVKIWIYFTCCDWIERAKGQLERSKIWSTRCDKLNLTWYYYVSWARKDRYWAISLIQDRFWTIFVSWWAYFFKEGTNPSRGLNLNWFYLNLNLSNQKFSIMSKIKLFSGSSNGELAQLIASHLGIQLGKTKAAKFSNLETRYIHFFHKYT